MADWTKWRNERLYWDTQRRVLPSGLQPSSTAIERSQHPMTYDAPRGHPQNVTGNNEYSGRAPFPESRTQLLTLPSARGLSVQGTQRLATSTFPPPTPSRASEFSLPSRREPPWSALSPLWNPINASESPQHQPMSHYAAAAPPARALNSRPSWVYPLRPGVAYKKIGEERRPVNKERNKGVESDEEEEEDDEGDEEEGEEGEEEDEECDDNDDKERHDKKFEGETEGEEEVHVITQGTKIHSAPTIPKNTPASQARVAEPIQRKVNAAQMHLRDVKPATSQPYTAQSKLLGPASSPESRIPQEHQSELSPDARWPEMRLDAKYQLTHETFASRPAPFDNSHPIRTPPEGPHSKTWPSGVIYLAPFSPANKSSAHHTRGSTNVAGPPLEWYEVSEAGASEHRSVYSLQSVGVARSIYMEQEIARREEEAGRREEEATRKEEGAHSLEMAARKALERAQGLEARAGQIRDAAMKAEAQVKRRDAEIWEKEAEVLRKQAEMAKREVEVARREIEAEGAEQEARRRMREVCQREEEFLLKEEGARRREEDVRRKEEDLQRKEDDVQRKEESVRRKEKYVRRQEREATRMEEALRQKTVEIRRREKKLVKREKSRRRATKVRIGPKGVLVAAWEKLKGRLRRGSRIDKKKSPARSHRYRDRDSESSYSVNDTDGSSVLTLRVSMQDSGRDGSTEDTPGPRDVEQWRSMVDMKGIQSLGDKDLKSVSNTIPSGCRTTTADMSAEYTVKTVHSYKERVHRSRDGHFRAPYDRADSNGR